MTASPSIAMAPGTYLATWDVTSGITDGCDYSTASANVSPDTIGKTSGLITVGSEGGALVVGCGGNGIGKVLLPAIPMVS